MTAWQIVKLDEVARRGSGHTPSKEHPEYWGGSVKWLSLRDTFRLDQGAIESTTATITEAGLAHSSAVLHPSGSVVLLRDAGIGKSGVLASEMAVSQHFMAWLCGARINNWFLYYFLQSQKQEFERISNGSTIKTIGLEYFRQLEVPLPAIEEQEIIAESLRDCDDHISVLERVISKKQAIKQGIMQGLLTGRDRLQGCEGGWKTVTYRDLVRIERGEMFKAGTAVSGPVPVIAAGRSPAAFIDRSNRSAPVVTISSSGASAGYVAYHSRPIFASDCSTISPNTLADLGFVYYSLVLRQDRIYRSQAGGAQPHVHAKDIYPLAVDVPPTIAEQRAIASVLVDVDDELELLHQRLAKARQVRQGMMQELLTGRTRLPVKEVEA